MTSKPHISWDPAVPGFGLRTYASGKQSWILNYRLGGRQHRIVIGSPLVLDREMAREVARQKLREIFHGNVPPPRAHAALTFGAAFKLYMEQHAKPRLKTAKELEAQFTRYLQPIADVEVDAITPLELQTLHTEIGEQHGQRVANKAIELVSALYNKLIEWDVFKGINPATKVKKFKKQSRERFILPEEMPRFLAAVQSLESDRPRDFFMLALLTGAREGNVLAMRWDDIDWANRLWYIRDTKSGTSATVPLVPQAMEILERRRPWSAVSPWVLPGATPAKHYAHPHDAWQMVLERSGLHDLRIHDLRRTLGSWQACLGVSLPIIAKTLNHTSTESTTVYARLQVQAVRDAMQRAVDAMMAASDTAGEG